MAAAAPLLAQPVLRGGDTLDTAAVQFLLAQSLLVRHMEEEERKKVELEGDAEGGGVENAAR